MQSMKLTKNKKLFCLIKSTNNMPRLLRQSLFIDFSLDLMNCSLVNLFMPMICFICELDGHSSLLGYPKFKLSYPKFMLVIIKLYEL